MHHTLQAAINCAVPMPLQTKDGLYLQWLDKALTESFATFQACCIADASVLSLGS